MYMLYLLLFPITLKSVLKARNSIMLHMPTVGRRHNKSFAHTRTRTHAHSNPFMCSWGFSGLTPSTRTTRWVTTWAWRKCVLKRSNAKGLPKLCAAYLKRCFPPAPPLSLYLSLTLFLGWAWLTCQPRQAGRQAKMQIFVKYMRVKIVVLHYPFNWIWRAHAGLKANTNTRSHQLSRQITAPEAAGKVERREWGLRGCQVEGFFEPCRCVRFAKLGRQDNRRDRCPSTV